MREVDLIIKGRYLLTMNNNLEVVEEGAVVVKDGKILAIGKSTAIVQEFVAKEMIDAGNNIVMPGMINLHTHVAMSYFRGLADDLKLDEWLTKYIWPAEAKNVNQKFVKWSGMLGCLEMVKSGVTCFNDMYFFEEELAMVAKKIGIRAVLGEGILDFSTPSCQTPEDAINKTINLIDQYKNDDLINITFAPHSIYTCSEELLKVVKDKAEEYESLIHIHLSETKKELEDSLVKYNSTPTKYLDTLGLLSKKLIAAHGVWLNEGDLELLSAKSVKIAHNPISNLKLVSGIAPMLDAYKKHKITVGFGTDGVASNNTQDLFTDMRVAALMHKITNEDPMAFPARDIVSMATIECARSLCLDNLIGSIEVGKLADIITINLNKPHLQPIYDPYSHLVYCANAGDVDDVVVNGRVIMRKRKVINADEEEILAAAKAFKLS